MATTNPITGDAIQTKTLTNAYADGWDRIFKKNKEKEDANITNVQSDHKEQRSGTSGSN